MFDKLKKFFTEKNEKKRTENLVVFLIILIITLIVINKILTPENKEKSIEYKDVELVNQGNNESVQVNSNSNEPELQKQLEEILSQISGVGEVKVLLTYSESSSISPLYNESTSSSTSTDSSGTTTETKTESKDIFTDSSNEAVIEKRIMPKLEGAIIIAQGAGNTQVKADIVSAVEAATGLLSHKIQVFEMKTE